MEKHRSSHSLKTPMRELVKDLGPGAGAIDSNPHAAINSVTPRPGFDAVVAA